MTLGNLLSKLHCSFMLAVRLIAVNVRVRPCASAVLKWYFKANLCSLSTKMYEQYRMIQDGFCSQAPVRKLVVGFDG